MSVSRTFPLSSGVAFAFTVFLLAGPGVAAAQPVDLISNFQVVSATIDHGTDLPTITFTFDCLANVSFIRLRSVLVQQRGKKLAESLQPRELRGCLQGTTVTMEVTYGFQGGDRFKPGPAQLDADLDANEGVFTLDSESIVTRVLLHPQK